MTPCRVKMGDVVTKLHVFFNPASGGYSDRRARTLLDMLRGAGFDAVSHLPHSAGETTRLVTSVCAGESPPLVIVAGGDGTVNAVINGIVPGRCIIGIIPFGTANVLARELGILSVEDAVSRIRRGMVRPVSVGEATALDCSKRFILMAGVGVDGSIVSRVRTGEKRLFGKGAYLLAAVRELAAWDGRTMTVRDGDRLLTCHSVVVANASRYAGPYRIAPDADLFSPLVTVVPIIDTTRAGFLRIGWQLVTGRTGRIARSSWKTAGPILVESDRPVQLDGDPFATGPVTVRTVAGLCRLIV